MCASASRRSSATTRAAWSAEAGRLDARVRSTPTPRSPRRSKTGSRGHYGIELVRSEEEVVTGTTEMRPRSAYDERVEEVE